MMKAITQIEAYGYQEVIKSWSTNHSKIKTVISNCETSRTSCYHSNCDARIVHHWVRGRQTGRGPVARYKSHVVACGEDNLVFMTNITNTHHPSHSLLAGTCWILLAGRGRGVFWAVTRIYISVEQSVWCCVSWTVSIFQLLSSLVMIMNTAGASRIIKSPGGSLHFFMWSLLSLL